MAVRSRTHVALLRGVNVLGRNTISMSVLREVVESLGHEDVVTYIRSGNVAFAAAQADADDWTLAQDLAAVIAERTGVKPAVIVIRAAELARVVRDNPFQDVPTTGSFTRCSSRSRRTRLDSRRSPRLSSGPARRAAATRRAL
jgi:uncharacterized protein (DUF1697 family)